tara:strand:+ start:2207 stop:2539 length:333 start_codon:yes stop_codon:yes gene_type:complete
MIIGKRAENFYILLKVLLISLYLISLFKVWNSSPKYLKIIDLIFNFTIGTLLIVIYNPFSKMVITNFHKKVAFSAGFAILINSAIIKYLTNKLEKTVLKKRNHFKISPQP